MYKFNNDVNIKVAFGLIDPSFAQRMLNWGQGHQGGPQGALAQIVRGQIQG